MQIIETPGFLDAESCRVLIAAHQSWSPPDRPQKAPSADYPTDYWHGRSLSYPNVVSEEARAVMRAAARNVAAELRRECPQGIYLDYMDLVVWRAPIRMDAHRDNANEYCRHRFASSIIYLNDDYEGGETFFPEATASVKPQAGKLVTFDSGAVHGVTQVRSGVRYTFPMWWTCDRTKAGHQQYIEGT